MIEHIAPVEEESGLDHQLAPAVVVEGYGRLSALRASGLTTDEWQRLKKLERANEILRTASAFFAQAKLNRRPK